MERLTAPKRGRSTAPQEAEDWGSEELRPGEGEKMRRLAMAAYQKLRQLHKLHPSVRTNPTYMAITMVMRGRGSTGRDGIKARLLRDFGLPTTTDLRATSTQYDMLQGLLDNNKRQARGSWEVLENTLELRHDKIWPCVARGLTPTRRPTYDAAVDTIMRILSPLQKGKQYTVRMDDRTTDEQSTCPLSASQYTSVHVRDPEVATAIIEALLGSQYPAPMWGAMAQHRVKHESAMCILLTGKKEESESTCHTDAIPGAWCVVTGSRTLYSTRVAQQTGQKAWT